MINNRQNGRRRGRGGGGPRPNNAPNPGNRQDNRSRGNAAQLHEKYKAMARDMQLAGDRVQTEYYLQFADHYFRVLNETRSRFEEQRPRRDDFMSDEDEDQDEAMMGQEDGDGDGRDERPQKRMDRGQRFDREDRGDREQRPERHARGDGETRIEREPRQDREVRSDRGEREQRPDREQRPARNGADGEQRNVGEIRPRRPRPRREEQDGDGNDGQIALDVLPPAIAPAAPTDITEAVKAPRRRVRRPQPEGDADIAPAA